MYGEVSLCYGFHQHSGRLADVGYDNCFRAVPHFHSGRTAVKKLVILTASVFVLNLPASQLASAGSDAELIISAEAAAPAAVSSNASIYAPQADGSMKTIREGKNGWWCTPDDPATPGPDPMCGDANSMGWAMAWMGKTEPPKGKIGFVYMLMGGPSASNLDPYITKPVEGTDWSMDRPHVMVVNYGDTMSGYPEKELMPDTTRPYVMWAGTPYQHLMLPVQ
jgi:hypothetical protein